VAQFEMLFRCNYLAPGDQGLQLTQAGQAWAAQLGVTLPKKSGPKWAYPCMDWSERKDHMAGSLAKVLLDHYLARHWLAVTPGSRALTLTAQGQRTLPALFAA
jgi:hypothetical protein